MARESRLSGKAVAIWLALFFVLGLGLRIGWNVDPSFDEDSSRYVYSGNDPDYHARVVRHITETGESVVHDPIINYPAGSLNPNPPLFDWTTAMVVPLFEAAGAQDPVGAALNTMVTIWGALTIFPVYVIASALWNRQAGLWAGFLMAVSAPSIQRGVWGYADHDATTMFWIAVAAMALVKGLLALDQREYVKSWRHGGALWEGMRNSFSHNRTAMLWSAVAGTALAATALTWKGYPYVLAIMAVALGLQLLWDHTRDRDSTAVWAFYMLPMLMVTLIPLPYYMVYERFMDTTIWAGIYVLIGMVVAGLILVPTRDLPSILVFPALAIAAALGLVLMLVVFKDVGQTIFTGLGYFDQSKLYTTIAEAQRSDLGRVAASFGFFTFLLAFWGFGRSFKSAWRGNNAHMLMVSWALVAAFMAFAASRFIMNAAPVFIILAAGVLVSLVNMLHLDEVRSRFRRQHGQNVVGAGLRSLTLRSTMGALMLAFFIVLPNAWIGVDAAVPREVDGDQDKMGAFGIEFDVKRNGWLEALTWLADQDTDLPREDRPAVVAWWDYGHWITDIGKHPTVADPFQNHYRDAGRVLSSESEQEAVAHLLTLLVNTDYLEGTPREYSPEVREVLVSYNESLLNIGPVLRANEYDVVAGAIDLEGEDVFRLYEEVMDATGKRIEYFAVDVRMYPISANNAGIFYAPVFLADKNPDDFLEYRYVGQTLSLSVEQYGVDSQGNSFRLAEPRITNAQGREYEVLGGQAFPKGAAIGPDAQGVPVQFSLNPTDAFYNSMYARAFGNDQTGFAGGDGLSHWRVVKEGAEGAVKMLQYYSGVEVSGRVVDDSGAPLEGMQVTFVDGGGAGHHTATTDADGRYTVTAPFSVDDDLRLVARSGGAEVANTTAHQFTQEQAAARESVSVDDLVVTRGAVVGTVFDDANGNDEADEGEGIEGATVSMGDRNVTTGADGSYSIPNVAPGSRSMTVSAPGYEAATVTVQVGSGESAEEDVPLEATPSQVTFTLEDQDGPVSSLPFSVDGRETRNPTTNATGQATATLPAGTYNVTVDYEVEQGGQQLRYTADTQITVQFGGQAQSFTIQVNRQEG